MIMRAAILKKPFELEDYLLPTLVENELRIQLEACGICGACQYCRLLDLAEKIASVKIDLQKFFLKEIAIIWSLLNPFTFQTAVELLVTNKVTVEPFKPEPLHFEALISFFSQPIDKSKIKYQFIQNNEGKKRRWYKKSN